MYLASVFLGMQAPLLAVPAFPWWSENVMSQRKERDESLTTAQQLPRALSCSFLSHLLPVSVQHFSSEIRNTCLSFSIGIPLHSEESSTRRTQTGRSIS